MASLFRRSKSKNKVRSSSVSAVESPLSRSSPGATPPHSPLPTRPASHREEPSHVAPAHPPPPGVFVAMPSAVQYQHDAIPEDDEATLAAVLKLSEETYQEEMKQKKQLEESAEKLQQHSSSGRGLFHFSSSSHKKSKKKEHHKEKGKEKEKHHRDKDKKNKKKKEKHRGLQQQQEEEIEVPLSRSSSSSSSHASTSPHNNRAASVSTNISPNPFGSFDIASPPPVNNPNVVQGVPPPQMITAPAFTWTPSGDSNDNSSGNPINVPSNATSNVAYFNPSASSASSGDYGQFSSTPPAATTPNYAQQGYNPFEQYYDVPMMDPEDAEKVIYANSLTSRMEELLKESAEWKRQYTEFVNTVVANDKNDVNQLNGIQQQIMQLQVLCVSEPKAKNRIEMATMVNQLNQTKQSILQRRLQRVREEEEKDVQMKIRAVEIKDEYARIAKERKAVMKQILRRQMEVQAMLEQQEEEEEQELALNRQRRQQEFERTRLLRAEQEEEYRRAMELDMERERILAQNRHLWDENNNNDIDLEAWRDVYNQEEIRGSDNSATSAFSSLPTSSTITPTSSTTTSTTVSPSVSPLISPDATAANTTSSVAPAVNSTPSSHPQATSTTSMPSTAPVVETSAVEPEHIKKSLEKFAPKTTNIAKFHLKMPNGERVSCTLDANVPLSYVRKYIKATLPAGGLKKRQKFILVSPQSIPMKRFTREDEKKTLEELDLASSTGNTLIVQTV